MPLSYLHYDVFTNEPLAGNQLAVFTDGRGLDTARMQRLAREMNFSESTFILPAEQTGTDIRMRIFTPYNEMPAAGHPTIGSTFALAAERRADARRSRVERCNSALRLDDAAPPDVRSGDRGTIAGGGGNRADRIRSRAAMEKTSNAVNA